MSWLAFRPTAQCVHGPCWYAMRGSIVFTHMRARTLYGMYVHTAVTVHVVAVANTFWVQLASCRCLLASLTSSYCPVCSASISY